VNLAGSRIGFLFRLGLVSALLVCLQVVILMALSAAGLAPPRIVDVPVPTIIVVLVVSCPIAVAVLWGGRLLHRRYTLVDEGEGECWMRPLAVTGECVIFELEGGFAALGFVSLFPERHLPMVPLLEAIRGLGVSATLVASRSLGGSCRFFLSLRCSAASRGEAEEEAAAACYGVEQELLKRGIRARWVQGVQELERFYWLCILGKEPEGEVAMRCKGGLVEVQVGLEPPKLLVALDLLGGFAMHGEGVDGLPAGLLSLLEGGHPLFLAVSLRPVAEEWVARRLRRLAASSPEVGMMVASLGETVTVQVLRGASVSLAAELAVLLAGRSEGLWECGFHLICLLKDAPSLLEPLNLTPFPLDCTDFTAVATLWDSEALKPASPSEGWLLPTSSLLRILGSSTSSHDREGDADGAEERGG